MARPRKAGLIVVLAVVLLSIVAYAQRSARRGKVPAPRLLPRPRPAIGAWK